MCSNKERGLYECEGRKIGDKLKEYNRQYYAKNKEKIKRYQLAHRKEMSLSSVLLGTCPIVPPLPFSILQGAVIVREDFCRNTECINRGEVRSSQPAPKTSK
jgi:hypothetical protein